MDENHGPVISVKGLKKIFFIGFFRRRVEALRGVDLEVKQNEILGFLGPNGAGKTTTIKILLGLIFPSAGEAAMLGKPVGNVQVKKKVGFLPEHPYFYDYLKGAEFLDFYARIHGINKAERKKRTDELLEKVGLSDAAGLALRKYSKGMLQRIGMAQALLGDPDLVILDEPMSGLDPVGRRDMREIIYGLKEEGKTVFFSSHILPDVEQICDRVCVIHKGKVRDTGKLTDILRPEVEKIDLQFTGLEGEALRQMEKLSEVHPDFRVTVKGEMALVVAPNWDAAESAKNLASQKGARLVSLQPKRETLESYFLREIDDE